MESLTRWSDAQSEQDKTTALLWMGFWAQGLQRKPHRGGRQGRTEVAFRYSCVQEGNWIALIDMWERDLERRTESLEKMKERRRSEDPTQRDSRDRTKSVKDMMDLRGLSYEDYYI